MLIPRSREMTGAGLVGDEQRRRGKVIPQIAAISPEQTIGMHSGVRADQKVRDNASLFAAASKISRENLTGEQGAFLRRWNKTQLPVGEKFVDLASVCERRSNLSQDTLAND